MNVELKRIYSKRVNLLKINIIEKSGAVTIDPLLFVLHQIDSKSLIEVF